MPAVDVARTIGTSRGLRAVLWAAALLFLAAAVMHTFPAAYYLYFMPPYVIRGAEMTTPIVGPTSDVVSTYDLDVNRLCKVELHRFVRTKATGRVVIRDQSVGGVTKPGRFTKVENILPLAGRPLAPGCYVLSTKAINECTEGIHVALAPELEFCVVDAPH